MSEARGRNLANLGRANGDELGAGRDRSKENGGKEAGSGDITAQAKRSSKHLD